MDALLEAAEAMNIGIFTDNDFDKVNGVTTALRAAVEYAPPDVRLRIYTCDPRGTDTPAYLSLKACGIGIPFYREMKMYVPPLRLLLRLAQTQQLDVIHVTTPGPLGLAALWIASRLQLPLIGSFHTHLAEYTRLLSGSRLLAALMRDYQRWLYHHCQRVLVPSEATRDLLVSGGLDPGRIALWTRGVSATRFSPARRSARLRHDWRASDTCPVVLYVGRLSHEKGLSALADIRAALGAGHIAHRLVFVGDGPMTSALKLQHPDAVFTGTLAPDDVATAMASSDLFVFPSRTDTAGNVVLEAQASGLPVLVTDEGGPKENLSADRSGVVCGSVEAMARQTAMLCADADLRASMGVEARRYALGRTWESALAPLYRAYRAATTSPAGVMSAASVVTHSPADEHSSRAPAA